MPEAAPARKEQISADCEQLLLAHLLSQSMKDHPAAIRFMAAFRADGVNIDVATLTKCIKEMRRSLVI
jgi:hypothetical protein